MHLAIDASRATRARRTGTENYARQLIQQLVVDHPDVRWTLFFQDDPGDWLAHHAHVERLVLPRPRMWTYTALAPALSRLRPDAFWEPAHVLPPTAPLLRIPSLVTVHDLGYEHFPAAHTAAQRHYLRLTTRYHSQFATHIAADSHATQHDLINLYGTDPKKITVVPLGVDHTTFRPITSRAEQAEVRSRYQTGRRFLLYVGTIQPRKNIQRLVRAFARIASLHPDVNLVLAGGQGWLADDLQAEIESLGIAKQVRRPGYIANEDLPALISAAEALVFPSLFEGFGLPALEAMACGTPLLTSRTSSLPEVVGNAALLVNPTDEAQIAHGLQLLLTQPALRATLRERGLVQAQTFTWTRSATQIWQLLTTLARDQNHKKKQIETISASHKGTEASTTNQAGHPSTTSPMTISILGLPIHNLTWQETLAQIAHMIKRGQPHQLVTVNPEFLMRARREPSFMALLKQADLVLADGVGLLIAAQWQGKHFKDRITGSDLTPKLAIEAARQGWRLYLLGAAPGVAEEAARRMRLLSPTLDVIADGSDPAPDGPPDLLARIRQAAPDILLVAYGAPKQDYWIAQFGKQTGVPVQIGIGGALDFIAEVVPRAPQTWQQLHLEWLWRLKEEPWRWRRMLALPHFALLAASEAMVNRKS